MVADITSHPKALAVRDLFRAAVAESLAIAKAVGKAATGLAGVVSGGLKGIVSATIPSRAAPAVTKAQGPPNRGGRSTP